MKYAIAALLTAGFTAGFYREIGTYAFWLTPLLALYALAAIEDARYHR